MGGFGIYFLNKHYWYFQKPPKLPTWDISESVFFVEQFPKALVSHLAAAFMLRQSKIPYIFWMLGACGALATRRLG